MLSVALDRLATTGVGGGAPERLAHELSPAERREAAIIHLAALVGQLPHETDSERVRIGALSLEVVEGDTNGDICYKDLETGFRVTGVDLAFNDGPSSMAALLKLLLYARERSDTLLYLPGDQRRARIDALAEQTGSDERFVRFLLAQAPAVQRYLAA